MLSWIITAWSFSHLAIDIILSFAELSLVRGLVEFGLQVKLSGDA